MQLKKISLVVSSAREWRIFFSKKIYFIFFFFVFCKLQKKSIRSFWYHHRWYTRQSLVIYSFLSVPVFFKNVPQKVTQNVPQRFHKKTTKCYTIFIINFFKLNDLFLKVSLSSSKKIIQKSYILSYKKHTKIYHIKIFI